MDITLRLLAEELSAFYPHITARGDERHLTRAVLLSELPTAADRETLYCCPADTDFSALPDHLCLAIVGTPRQPFSISMRNYLLIQEDAADISAVFSRIQEVFLRFWRWYAELLRASQGTDVQTLVDTTASMFPSGLNLLSIFHNRVFSGGGKNVEVQAQWERIFRTYADPEARAEHFLVAEDEPARQNPYFIEFASGEHTLVCHVLCDGMRMGTFFAPIPQGDNKQRYVLCMNELMRCGERMYAAMQQNADDPLTHALRRMLLGDRLTTAELKSLCRAEGWAASGHTLRVMVIRSEKQAEKSFRCEQLLYRNVVSSIYHKSKVFIFHDEIIVVRDFTVHDAFEESENSLEVLNCFLETHHATMGASAPFSELSQLHLFYAQARMLAAASKNTSLAMHEYSNYLPYDMIRSFAETHAINHYIHPEISKLAELETRGNADLLLSLYLYLLNDRSYQACAEKLSIHRNSFAYRINKVLNVLSCDWNNENVRLSLLLSICIYWYQHPDQDPIGISHWRNNL